MTTDYSVLSKEAMNRRLCEQEHEFINLKKRYEFSLSALSNAPMAIIKVSPSGVIQYANPFACNFLGYSIDCLIGMNILEHVSYAEYEKIVEHTAGLSPAHTSFYQTICHLMPDKQRHDYVWSIHAEYNDRRKIDYFFGFCFPADNIEQISLRERLEREQRFTTLALAKSEVYAWEYDVEKDLFYNNASLLVRYGYPLGEQPYFTHKTLMEIIHPDDREDAEKNFVNILNGSEPEGQLQTRVRVKREDGSYAYEWFEQKYMTLTNKRTNRVYNIVGTTTSIERFKQIEIELLAAKNEAEESSRLKSAFVANMSHEIRTPLNAIIGFSEVLSMEEDPEEKAEYVRIIQNNNELLLNLINDILDMSRIESGKMELAYSVVDINAFIEELGQSARLRITNPEVEVVTEKALSSCVMSVDRSRMIQVLMNFIGNAAKFTHKGAVTIGYTLTTEGDKIRFYVRDTGIGISKEKQRDVFKRFIKLNDFVQGTGLGLSICETVVNKLGGDIGVDSELGVGSEFWFTLPYKPILA